MPAVARKDTEHYRKTEGYPTLEEAKAAGLFHPNCRHAYGLYIDLDKEIKERENIEVTEEKDKGLFPDEIAGVKRGKKMTRDEANGEKPNPNFRQGNGYMTNCQSCVVTYEARLRGYDVQTLPNTKGSMLDKLSRKTNIAWIDPATGKHPDYIFDDTITNASKFAEFLEKVIEPNKRYTLEFLWIKRGRTGHIISVDRTADGILRLYDPQNGKTYIKQEVLEYLKQLKYSKILPPKILRIDDKQFNLDVVNYIMEGVRK